MGDPFSIYNKNHGSKKQGSTLDWEESLGNPQEPGDYYEAHSNKSSTRLFAFALLLIFAGLAGRLLYLQILHGAYYSKLSLGNHVRVQEVLAPRGIIFDSQGQQLVQNVPSFELVATPLDLPADTTKVQGEISSLATLLGGDPKAQFDQTALLNEIDRTAKDSYNQITVLPDMTHDTAVLFESHQGDYPGFSVENNPIRNYADPLIFSHVLGYTGKISQSELQAHSADDYLLNDYIGKNGLELTYEKYLRGVAGQKQVEVDASGKVQSVLGQVDAQTGDGLQLNIDADLQRELYNEIVSKNGDKKAAAVAIDPQNGKVLALVSVPGFDNNLFAQGITQAEYDQLANDPKQPLFDRAISGTYPPGSTIKPVMASAALQEGVVNENTKIVDNGDIVVGKFQFHGWKAGGLGAMDIRSAIAWSSDIYFYTVGGGQANLGIAGLGPARIEKYDYLFGMGQKLGIDLMGEAAGIIGGPTERKARYSDPTQQAWYLGDTYHVSIGQGDMAVTPLQVAEWTATVANGGTLYKPYIVDKVIDSSGKTVLQNQPQVIRSDFIDPKYNEIVREGMRQTVTAGTAKLLQSLPITSAGKTGTAQFDDASPSSSHAWFTAFAPYDSPQIAVTVLIEAGGEGSTVSEPIVKDVLDWWAKNRYLKTTTAAAH